MGLFEKKYTVFFRNGKRKNMTAKNILVYVEEASIQSNYNWFASSEELVRICKLPDFPQDVAVLIEAAILDCYSNIENSVRIYPDSNSNVVYCYNSLVDKEEYSDLIRKYISSVLHCVINYGMNDEPRFLPVGETYKKMCSEWKNSIENEFVSSHKKISNLDLLYQVFSENFENMLNEAEKKGLFDKDEKAILDVPLNNISSWKKVLKNHDYYPDPDQIR